MLRVQLAIQEFNSGAYASIEALVCRSDGLDALQQQALASVPDEILAKSSNSLRMSGGSALQESVKLLTACRPEELHKLEQLTGSKKILAVFRCSPDVALFTASKPGTHSASRAGCRIMVKH